MTAKQTEKPLTGNIRSDGEMLSLKEYEQVGGYEGLRKALNSMSPKEVTDAVVESNLRGRGGAGFPTGKKWTFVPTGEVKTDPTYLISNSDEMEPGSFKDRVLMEMMPHQLLEGMMIASYAIQADIAYIFLRWAYKRAERTLRSAIAEAYDAGYLGKNILGTGYNLELYVHTSAGRYMCGEETGLLDAIEGKRATPRAKPPYPQLSGLWGKDTIVNNAETLSNVPHIIVKGAQWFKDLSYTEDGGTKIYGVSGRVKNPGWWELPMGTTAREILEKHAGGMREGLKFRALIPGGASTEFMLDEHLDIQMDFNAVPKVGSRLGTGTMMVLDDQNCPVGMLLNLEHFFAQESCGWCTPCRDGLPWVERILEALENGEGQDGDIEQLERHARLMAPGNTFCALAPGAAEPLLSGIKYFREDLERHIREKRCPWR
jgi:NADH-quinone oxidoreductase subunit F